MRERGCSFAVVSHVWLWFGSHHLRFPAGFQQSQRPTLLDSQALNLAASKSDGTEHLTPLKHRDLTFDLKKRFLRSEAHFWPEWSERFLKRWTDGRIKGWFHAGNWINQETSGSHVISDPTDISLQAQSRFCSAAGQKLLQRRWGFTCLF